MQVNWIPFSDRWPPVNETLWVAWNNRTDNPLARLAEMHIGGLLFVEDGTRWGARTLIFGERLSIFNMFHETCWPGEIFAGAPTHWALFERPNILSITEA